MSSGWLVGWPLVEPNCPEAAPPLGEVVEPVPVRGGWVEPVCS
jgi:hypothetical protein